MYKSRKLLTHSKANTISRLRAGQSCFSQQENAQFPPMAASTNTAGFENHTATAVMEDGRMIVWASCQTPYPTQEGIAEELGMEVKDVRLMPIFIGGGFGGKIYHPQVMEVVQECRSGLFSRRRSLGSEIMELSVPKP